MSGKGPRTFGQVCQSGAEVSVEEINHSQTPLGRLSPLLRKLMGGEESLQ